MNTPTHEAVAKRAHQIWQSYGSPDGRDTEIWFEAERQLAAESRVDADARAVSDSSTTERLKAETAAESVVEYQISPAIPEEAAIKAALQKQEARAPIVSHHTGPKAKAPESGKPLWNQPHSS